jgi:hypothetical protein
VSLRFVHGQCVFVVSVADLTSNVLQIRTLVDQTLCIMDISIVGSTTGADGFGRVLQVDKYDAGSASVVSRHRTDGVREAGFFIDDDVVCTASRQGIEMSGQILCIAESDWLRRVNG